MPKNTIFLPTWNLTKLKMSDIALSNDFLRTFRLNYRQRCKLDDIRRVPSWQFSTCWAFIKETTNNFACIGISMDQNCQSWSFLNVCHTNIRHLHIRTRRIFSIKPSINSFQKRTIHQNEFYQLCSLHWDSWRIVTVKTALGVTYRDIHTEILQENLLITSTKFSTNIFSFT